jgi:RNA polymerase sigma-32 factor
MNSIDLVHASKTDQSVTSFLDLLRMYYHEISKSPLLSKDEEKEIAERIRLHGDKEAEHRLITGNLKLVVKIAAQYSPHLPKLLDLIQEGNLGLMRAARKYDSRRGTSFSTYAAFWIHASILKYLADSRSLVKFVTNDTERRLLSGIRMEGDRLEKLGIETSSELLADALGVRISEVEDMLSRRHNGDVSLDEPSHANGDALIDVISSGEDIEEKIADWQERKLLGQWLDAFKERLTDKGRFILENRIMAEQPMTLQAIGERFNTSRESVRRMQTRISRALLKTLRSNVLHPTCESIRQHVVVKRVTLAPRDVAGQAL